MKLIIMMLACVLSARPPLSVSAERHAIDVDRSRVTVRVFKSGMFSVLGDDHVITAPIASGYLEDETMPGIEIHIDPHRMRVTDAGLSPGDREAVQKRMLGSDVLDADRFPDVWFRSTTVEVIDRDRWFVRGSLTLHGQTRSVALIAIYEDGSYRGSTTLRQHDFGITPISVAGGTVRVKDELRIEFDIALTG
jgi:polyisoprenoid-binding protein YceI